ncbi:hypothetical protein BDB01DRAFT_610368 [Pilobolus umbonatus]|nr:hypothetical protein BDB01DRAFT_610368 [Pilobolus umbonatus]
MNLNYDYVRPLFDLLNSTDQVLQNRNEAHITVISPPEYDILAASGMTIDEINSIALDMSIQSSVFDIICIGKEDVIVNRERSVVYQFIVHSPNLLAIRRKIFQLYSDYNGNTALFDPESYWPHVTIGYTLTDVFVQHGVYKGSNVCYSPVLIDYEQ